MSEIREMIRELCPDGVEFKKLGEIAKCYSGATPKTNISNYWDNGTIPWMNSGEVNLGRVFQTEKKITQLGYDSCSTKMVPPHTVVVALAGQGKTRGTVAITEIELCTNQSLCAIEVQQDIVNSYFLWHYLRGQYQTLRRISSGDGTRGGLNQNMIRNFEIPVPPMAVQRKIVEILDNFSNLTAELEAELEERKRQYEYYRNLLLTFNPVANGAVTGGEHQINDTTENRGGLSVKWLALSEIGEMIKGSGIQKSDFVEQGLPCIHYGQLHTYYGTFAFRTKSFISKALFDRSKKAQHGDLIIATTSEDVEACCKATAWLGEEEIAVSGDAHIFHHNQNPKYLAYFFQTENFAKQKRKYASGVKVVRVKGEQLLKVIIPLPSLEEQQRIVDILDRFETLTTDLQSGIPAEIAARRQQYEYYREQLLTFKRKAA